LRLLWSRHEEHDCLRLTGVDALTLGAGDFARYLPVYPSAILSTTMVPSLHGSYALDGAAVCFVPRFPFVAGTEYTLLVHRSLSGGRSERVPGCFDVEDYEPLTITRPTVTGDATTRVVEIYPTAREVPRNVLRLYVHFSAPMSEGFAASRVHLRRTDTGEEIAGALLPMDPELWDPGRRRLTVLFDPARIKRGLAPHREIGYPLEVGVAVDVDIDVAFLDADGRPLVSSFSRHYEVGGDERTTVDPHQWRLATPAAGTADPLIVSFDRPLDHALLQHCITIVDADEHQMAGSSSTATGERSWRFAPDDPWARARYRLAVDPILEDLAGNSLRRVFDRDISDPDQTPERPVRDGIFFSPS
jgi:hypothetical protein